MNTIPTPTIIHEAAGVGSHWLQALAHRIADSDITRHEADVVRAARYLRAAAQCPVLLSILTDVRQPSVARERAFGQLLVEAALPQTTATVAA